MDITPDRVFPLLERHIIKVIVGVVAVAVIASIAVAVTRSSSQPSARPAPRLTFAEWYNDAGYTEIQVLNQDIGALTNDENYGDNPTSDAEALASDAQTGLSEPPTVDAADWNAWLKYDISEADAAEESETTHYTDAADIAGQRAANNFANTVTQHGLTLPGN